jgi:DNA-binding transcriptional MerR regulator
MLPVMDELLAIGRFSRLSGLSIGALRHYDELDLLRPAQVDEWTGYRSYRRAQLGRARAIRRLRDLELPIETIRAYLDEDDPDQRRSLLVAHFDRVQARTWRLQRVLHVLSEMTRTPRTDAAKETEPMAVEPPIPAEIDPATERRLAADLFNRTWELLEAPSRTALQDDEMIHTAHASRYHWGQIGEPANLARGEWQCSRVYAVLRHPEPALWHARRCLAICEEHGLGDWDIAAAHEAMARASLVTGDEAAAREWLAKARTSCAAIADEEDRRIIESDLETLALD